MAAKKKVTGKAAKARKAAPKPAKAKTKPARKPAARPAKKPAARTQAATKKPSQRAHAKAAPAARKSQRAKVAKPKKAPVAKAPKAAKPAKAEPLKVAARPAAPIRPEPRRAVAVAVARKPQPVPVSLEDDEGEGEDRHNLLLGPRNVTPYIARKGEEYMSREQLDHFRLILESWKQDLMLEVDRTMTHMKDEAANPPDPNDRATLESEFALELRTRDRERKLIRKIEEALKRIEDGSYGYCLETGEPIGIKRLEARPVATLCIEAQERRERREKQYGDRDDWYR